MFIRLRSIPGIIAFSGVILSAGFSAIYIMVNVGIMGRAPSVDDVSPSEIARGQEMSVIGENLDLVSELYLSSLSLPIPARIFHKL